MPFGELFRSKNNRIPAQFEDETGGIEVTVDSFLTNQKVFERVAKALSNNSPESPIALYKEVKGRDFYKCFLRNKNGDIISVHWHNNIRTIAVIDENGQESTISNLDELGKNKVNSFLQTIKDSGAKHEIEVENQPITQKEFSRKIESISVKVKIGSTERAITGIGSDFSKFLVKHYLMEGSGKIPYTLENGKKIWIAYNKTKPHFSFIGGKINGQDIFLYGEFAAKFFRDILHPGPNYYCFSEFDRNEANNLEQPQEEEKLTKKQCFENLSNITIDLLKNKKNPVGGSFVRPNSPFILRQVYPNIKNTINKVMINEKRTDPAIDAIISKLSTDSCKMVFSPRGSDKAYALIEIEPGNFEVYPVTYGDQENISSYGTLEIIGNSIFPSFDADNTRLRNFARILLEKGISLS